MSGEISIDDAGDRRGNVQVMNIQNGDFKQVRFLESELLFNFLNYI